MGIIVHEMSYAILDLFTNDLTNEILLGRIPREVIDSIRVILENLDVISIGEIYLWKLRYVFYYFNHESCYCYEVKSITRSTVRAMKIY